MSLSFNDTVSSAIDCIKDDDTIIAAVSGGADSTALLAALCELQKKMVNVIHVNHNLRGNESNIDAEFVKNLCADLSVPCNIVTIPKGFIEKYAKEKGCGIEAAARFARQKAFADEALRLSAAYILTAHTKNDAVETILMRLLRGAGPRGLAGIKKTGFLKVPKSVVGKISLLRPLLSIDRNAVESYLTERNFRWQTDSTNSSDLYLRNKIRLHLIPVLDQHFSNWSNNLLSTAETQNLIAEFIEHQVDAIKITAPPLRHFGFDEKSFFLQDEIIREEAVFRALDMLNVNDTLTADPPIKESSAPRRKTIRDFCSGKTKNAHLGAFKISQSDGSICISPQDVNREHGAYVLIKEGEKYKFDGLTIECVSVEDKTVRLMLKCCT